MTKYKLHLAGKEKTKEFGYALPICGKISLGIEYDTLTATKFKEIKFENRCHNCHNIYSKLGEKRLTDEA